MLIDKHDKCTVSLGRYVSIQIPGPNEMISLCEVQVYTPYQVSEQLSYIAWAAFAIVTWNCELGDTHTQTSNNYFWCLFVGYTCACTCTTRLLNCAIGARRRATWGSRPLEFANDDVICCSRRKHSSALASNTLTLRLKTYTQRWTNKSADTPVNHSADASVH